MAVGNGEYMDHGIVDDLKIDYVGEFSRQDPAEVIAVLWKEQRVCQYLVKG